tara:strand:+ start:2156 stop:2617 length:462 start_codon:yes stop_codon:yes gene_type:complete
MIIRQIDEGSFSLQLSEIQKELISLYCAEVRSSIKANEGIMGVSRLFPPAYDGMHTDESEYRAMVHSDLVSSHVSALDNLVKSLIKDEITESELQKMMQALNILRLFLGERLDISGGNYQPPVEEDPDYNTWLIFQLFGEMLSVVVDTLQKKI